MDEWERRLSLEVYQCAQCRHMWHHMQPDQQSIFDMYRHGASVRVRTRSNEPTRHIQEQVNALYRLVRRPAEGRSTFLDYGSGAGKWSIAAQRAGFEVYAYEPTAERQIASGKVISVQSLDILQGRRFDVINLEQVLEHIPEPHKALVAVRACCDAGTVVRVTVPNLDRNRKMLWSTFPYDGKEVHILSPYEHLHGFNMKSLDAVMKRSGYRHLPETGFLRRLPLHALRRRIGHVIRAAATTLYLGQLAR
jgi:2-polyprenyl-3-methyl-5-hydroxy-6-metoxy-1,4-benzoquinol methylase